MTVLESMSAKHLIFYQYYWCIDVRFIIHCLLSVPNLNNWIKLYMSSIVYHFLIIFCPPREGLHREG